MGDTARVIAIFYLVVVIVSVVPVVAVVWSTLVRPRARTDVRGLAARERLWMVGVLAALAVLLFATIFFAPYGDSAGANAQVVRVTAFQFGWRIDPASIRAGSQVEFRLEADDVNHGFGLYNSDDVLLKQVQVMPDHEQRLVYTFEKPGTYRILCLEYCGIGHHRMTTTFRVTP